MEMVFTYAGIRPAVSSVDVQRMVASETRLTSRNLTVMTTINSEQFGEICNGVWSDRAAVLRGRGLLSGEATLVRAVFWRLCKAGVKPAGSAESYNLKPTILAYQSEVDRMLKVNARPAFDGASILKELVERYQNEVGHSD
jgi:hypothetical protein